MGTHPTTTTPSGTPATGKCCVANREAAREAKLKQVLQINFGLCCVRTGLMESDDRRVGRGMSNLNGVGRMRADDRQVLTSL